MVEEFDVDKFEYLIDSEGEITLSIKLEDIDSNLEKMIEKLEERGITYKRFDGDVEIKVSDDLLYEITVKKGLMKWVFYMVKGENTETVIKLLREKKFTDIQVLRRLGPEYRPPIFKGLVYTFVRDIEKEKEFELSL